MVFSAVAPSKFENSEKITLISKLKVYFLSTYFLYGRLRRIKYVSSVLNYFYGIKKFHFIFIPPS